MLNELYLQNLVIFTRASLRFGEGLNVISGETGAGKSLLAAALALALGARADAEMIRSGEESAQIKAVFSFPDNPTLIEKLREIGVDSSEENLLFARQIRAAGSSRRTLNDIPISGAAAKEIADSLLDLAAQNEHTRLYDAVYQRELLDLFGDISLAAYREVFQPAAKLFAQINAGDAAKQEAERERERLQYQLQKIAAANFCVDDLQLSARIDAVKHREQIATAATNGLEILQDREDALLSQIAQLRKLLTPAANYQPEIAAARDGINAAENLLSEAARQLSKIDADEEKDLDALIAREEELKNLARLLDCEIAKIPDVEIRLREREQEISETQFDADAAKRELAKLSVEIAARGAELTKKRIAAGEKLAKKVNRELRDLEMPQANFSVQVENRTTKIKSDDENFAVKIMCAATGDGLDDVRFLLAPNAGEPANALAQTASGGETARTMLAIKTALAEQHRAPTMFFDEIDSGVGGRLGDALGKKLRELAKSRQVIVITHLPQIAAYAETHLKIVKTTQAGRVTAHCEEMTGEKRCEEIAQMINGAAATKITREQAAEMLAKGQCR